MLQAGSRDAQGPLTQRPSFGSLGCFPGGLINVRFGSTTVLQSNLEVGGGGGGVGIQRKQEWPCVDNR